MDEGTPAPGGRQPGFRPAPASARDRLAAAVRDDARGPGPHRTEEPPPRLPPEEGLEPVRRLGDGSWLVRESRSREVFVLRLCTGADGAERVASRRALLALAVDLAGREEPHLVAVRGLLGPAAEPVGLVEEFLPGGSLADRLAERGPLAPDEAAAVLRDAAAGLAALHGLGRCHGGLTARQILFRRAGSRSWAGTEDGAGDGTGVGPESGAGGGSGGPALAAVRPGTGDGSPPEDVRALGVVGWTVLTGRAPAAGRHRAPLARLRPDVPARLCRAVESALAENPSGRPTAAELVAGLELLPAPVPASAAPAAAIPRTRRAALGPAGIRSSRRASRCPAAAPPSRRRTALLAMAAALVLATGAALLRPGPEPGRPDAVAPHETAGTTGSAGLPETALPEPGLPDPAASGAHVPGPAVPASADPTAGERMEPGEPQEALRRLVARRGEALRTGNARLLDRVYVPGAAAAADDRATIARAAAAGDRVFADLVLQAGRIRGAAPRPGPTVPGGVTLEAEVRVEGYRGHPGRDPSVLPAGEGWVQTVVVVLVRGAEGWRLAAVEPRRERPAGTGAATQSPRR
ncbi:protein kinase [Kocuria sediminis]|uniref:Protein kinase n=1 Tax=Kocuria sediminis TaxID=1038857 RepID=A0A6N8GTJ4_9MICC|nr:protein kinase [Kocuria sediminis]MUN64144.1 protein kinase [Kocuria sediminis]